MSRREIAVNVLLGALLLLLLLFHLFLSSSTQGFSFAVLGPSVEPYFSRLGIPDGLWELVLFAVILLWTRYRPSNFKEV